MRRSVVVEATARMNPAARPAEVEDLRRAVGCRADQDLYPGPVLRISRTSRAKAQASAPLAAGRAQHGGQAGPRRKNDDGLEAILVVVGVRAQLLPTVNGVEGVIYVQGYAAAPAGVRSTTRPWRAHPQQGPRPRQVLEPRDGWLGAERGGVGRWSRASLKTGSCRKLSASLPSS